MAGLHTERLEAFASFVAGHIRGDEKGEAQVFLDRLFRAFGHEGAREAGATFEERIKKADGRGTNFADLVWRPVVLIEMKRRGADLTKHYRQAFDYWVRLVPGRPRYVVLCNFDEFWIYDFDAQIDTPLDKVRVEQIATRWGPLAFLSKTPERPTFGNDQVAVTRQAADHLAALFNLLVDPRRLGGPVERPRAQRFVLQALVALFAEDIGLLPRYFVAQLLDECARRQDSYDLLGGLFDAMNSPGRTPGGRYAGVEYFNGGLFAEPARVELSIDELDHLKVAARDDWSKVRPEVFGTLFEHSMGQEERHAFGAHFTSPVDILKIVGPTIVEPWREQIEAAKTLRRLRELWERMQHYTVLDPACGSGNFLYVAYRELKRLEARIFERMAEEFPSEGGTQQGRFGFVTARQFFGLDINPFAVELAKVTMMIARKLAIEELHVNENALPLDNLDANFRAADALIDDLGNPAAWPKVDVIIGNPPFLGAKRLKPERGADYVNTVRKAYPDVPGMADYCVYWFRKAHDLLPPCTAADPLAGRAGLVGTQNVRNNQSRVGGLDHVVKDGTIIEAVDNQPWSGEANVHVSIVNWVKTQDAGLLPSGRRLWHAVKSKYQAAINGRKLPDILGKVFELDFNECSSISPSLSDKTDVSLAARLHANEHPQVVFNGQYPRHKGYRLAPYQAIEMIKLDGRNAEVLHPLLIGQVMLTEGQPMSWSIDFERRGLIEAQSYVLPFSHLQKNVLPHVERLAREEARKTGKSTGQDQNWLMTWWQHFRSRPEMVRSTQMLPRYMACVELTKRPILCFIDSSIRPDKTLEVFALADDYSFGLLQSSLHTLWFWAKCSNFKTDPRYTPESVFDTFPWPQSPTIAQVDAVAEAGRGVRRVRAEALTKIKGGLRAVYRTMELPGKNPLKDAHEALDAAVRAAYGFGARDDLLARLLELNRAVADRESRGEAVTAPGVPPGYPEPSRLVTEDCIRAPERP